MKNALLIFTGIFLAGYVCYFIFKFFRDSVSFFGRIVIVCSATLATISMFAAWVDIPLAKDYYGYSTPAPLLLFLWWHPLKTATKNLKLNKKTAYSTAITAVFLGLYLPYLISQKFVIKIGSGLFLFSLSSLILLYGVYIYTKDQKEADPSSTIDENMP